MASRTWALAADLNEDGTAEILVGGSRAAVLGEVPGYVAVVSPVDAIPLILHGGELQLHNATGTHTTIGAFGSITVADNEVTLFGRNMAPASFGHFITSPTAGGALLGSSGVTYIGAAERLVAPGQVQASDATGRFSIQVDLTQFPKAAGVSNVMAGETYYFQLWHRDPAHGPTATGCQVSDPLNHSSWRALP